MGTVFSTLTLLLLGIFLIFVNFSKMATYYQKNQKGIKFGQMPKQAAIFHSPKMTHYASLYAAPFTSIFRDFSSLCYISRHFSLFRSNWLHFGSFCFTLAGVASFTSIFRNFHLPTSNFASFCLFLRHFSSLSSTGVEIKRR